MQGIVIAGTHSGCGKTTITLGILAALKKKGHRVQPFKIGPDFIDTGLHRLVTGRTSRNLDQWMCGEDYVRDCFQKYSADADISVIEGVMGLYDGKLSTASLATMLNLPVVLVVDAYGMAESAGAVVKGFKEYSKLNIQNSKLSFAGVIFNRVGSENHFNRLKDSINDVHVLGYLPRDLDFEIPHRHLGLTVAEETPISAEEINKLSDAVLKHIDVEVLIQDSKFKIQNSKLPTPNSQLSTPKSRIRVAVAYDKAFCFYYEDNLDLLREAGAEIVKFSPLSDSKIPEGADVLYLGGGYPEIHARELSDNSSMLESVRSFADEGRPVYAECGGFMYLTQGIYDLEDRFYSMSGVFPFKTRMTKGRARLGYRGAVLKEDSILGKKGSSVRGHEFHYSEIVNSSQRTGSIYSVKDGSDNYVYDEGYKIKNTLGSYLHIHFGSNPEIAGNFISYSKEHYGTDFAGRTRQP